MALIDVLDRVLDKGIVFDAWLRASGTGIDLITAETHVIIVSSDIYLKYAQSLSPITPPGSSLSAFIHSRAVSVDPGVPASAVLFIVAADRRDLFEMWTAEFPGLTLQQIIMLDRRSHDRRQQRLAVHEDRRRTERRTHTIDEELELFGLAVVALPQTSASDRVE
jgi:hypothetical protein